MLWLPRPQPHLALTPLGHAPRPSSCQPPLRLLVQRLLLRPHTGRESRGASLPPLLPLPGRKPQPAHLQINTPTPSPLGWANSECDPRTGVSLGAVYCWFVIRMGIESKHLGTSVVILQVIIGLVHLIIKERKKWACVCLCFKMFLVIHFYCLLR